MQKRTSKKDDFIKAITITREEIEEKNFDKIEWILEECLNNKDNLADYFQSAVLAIDGYENEKREPYQNKKFQEYSVVLLQQYPELIWLLNLEIESVALDIILMAFVNDYYTDDINNQTTLIIKNANKEKILLSTLFNAINTLVNRYGFDYSYNQNLTQKVIDLYNKILV